MNLDPSIVINGLMMPPVMFYNKGSLVKYSIMTSVLTTILGIKTCLGL